MCISCFQLQFLMLFLDLLAFVFRLKSFLDSFPSQFKVIHYTITDENCVSLCMKYIILLSGTNSMSLVTAEIHNSPDLRLFSAPDSLAYCCGSYSQLPTLHWCSFTFLLSVLKHLAK